ncbi:hypothetical protein ACQKWADRAFT_305063 [Trichoderma austrokoningii]
MEINLYSLITPAVLKTVAYARVPYPKDKPIDFNTAGEEIFGDEYLKRNIRDISWPALVALSKLGLSNVPDLLSFLPKPEDAEFPQQCFGLVVLLDQAPRLFCKGIDARWVSYFDTLSERLTDAWRALPAHQQPDSWARWRDEVGAGIDHWAVARLFFTAPLAHGEKLAYQDIAVDSNEHLRELIETYTSEVDSNRARRAELLSDPLGFFKNLAAGSPKDGDITMQRWTFWLMMMMDSHYPIIKKFGRKPYKNAIEGRESTAEEVKWLEDINHAGEASPEVAKRVKEDIKAGIWTPLGNHPRDA